MRSKIGWITATALVVSNMIGTGVFTSLGYQLPDLHNTISILLLWFIGGILSLIGAFIYIELASNFKQSGGDYIYLSRTYHPLLGYLSSWVSMIVGFSAPIALAALAMSKYLNVSGWHLEKGFAITVIVLIAFFMSGRYVVSRLFQNVFTALKVLFVLVLIAIGWYVSPSAENTSILWDESWKKEIVKPAFASSLVYVTFAYTGWSAASYIIEEIRKPLFNLPKALFAGVGFVTVAYLLLNYIFLKHASIAALTGVEDVANVSFQHVLGKNVKWVSFFIGLQLVATISGYLWIGSRLAQATAKEYFLWSFLKSRSDGAVPSKAIWLYAAVSILLIFSGSFETILTYTSFVLQLMATAAVSTAFFIPGSKRVLIKHNIFYVLPATFVAVSGYICYYVFTEKTKESMIGLLMLLAGILCYGVEKKLAGKLKSNH